MKRLFRLISGPSDDEIIAVISPWILACAVGATNGSSGFVYGFEMWLQLSRDNWFPEVKERTKTSDLRIEKAIRRFAKDNYQKDMFSVMCEQETARGIPLTRKASEL